MFNGMLQFIFTNHPLSAIHAIIVACLTPIAGAHYAAAYIQGAITYQQNMRLLAVAVPVGGALILWMLFEFAMRYIQYKAELKRVRETRIAAMAAALRGGYDPSADTLDQKCLSAEQMVRLHNAGWKIEV